MGDIFGRAMWSDGAPFENWLADPDAPAVATRHICHGGGKSGGGGGGTTTQTSTVQIPQAVLDRYNSVNAQAQQAAGAPFTAYPGEMVAPLNPVQNTAIAQTLGQIGQAQPYFDAATNSLLGGVAAAYPYYDQSGNLVANASNTSADATAAAAGALVGGNAAASGYNQAAGLNAVYGQQQGQTMAQSALQALYGAQAGAQPFNQQAASTLANAQNSPYLQQAGQLVSQLAANPGQAADYSSLGQGFDLSGLLSALGGIGANTQSGAPAFNLQALQSPTAAPNVNLGGIAQAAQPYQPQISTPNVNLSGITQSTAGLTPPSIGTNLQTPQVTVAPSASPGASAGSAPIPQITMPDSYYGSQGAPPPQIGAGGGGGGGAGGTPDPTSINSLSSSIPTSSSLNFNNIGSGFDPAAFMKALNFQIGQAPDANMNAANASLQSGISGSTAPLAQAASYYSSAGNAADPYTIMARNLVQQGQSAADPFNAQAQAGISAALQGASPLQDQATTLAQAAAQGITPAEFSQQAVQKYMSPYTRSVVDATMKQLQQQQAMEQQSLVGNLISKGAFGNDRGNIDRAVLANQHDMATGSILSNLYNQDYAQALGAFQQQQGVDLSAAQSNRAAQLAASGQLGNLGQQGFGQQLSAAQAQAGLGQQIFGQNLATGQTLGNLGQQVFGQNLAAGQAQAALGAQLFGQGNTAAQTQSQLQQNVFNQWAQQQGLQQQATATQGQLGLGAAQTQQAGQIAQGQLGLGQESLAQQGKIAQGQLGLGAAQIQANKEIAQTQASIAQAGVAAQMAGIQQQGQIAQAQIGFQQQQLMQQGQIAAGQLGLSQAQIQQAGQIAAAQLGLQGTQLSQEGQIAMGQLALGQAQVQQQGALGFGQLGVQQQLGLGQLGLGQAGLAQQGQISQAQLGLQGALGFGQLSQQGQIAGAQLAQQQQQNLFGQQLSTAQLGAQLGAQQFGQNLSTAQLQAALGQQQFGQGATVASQLGTLGNQLYQQGTGTGAFQAGLGQQLFGQGATTAQTLGQLGQQQSNVDLAAAQQMAGMGQSLYGLGSNTANQLAGIGTGQQQTALSLAQSILGAGTVQQQTQQAADQAYVNQFLQGQGYPFQVAQFLAGIAEGTGALSGSTTTAQTTQPGSIFSDEKLKEGKEEIGKTFDGQPIYRFNYKDDPGTTRIGLMAQDVEKRNPSAVGESDGYKTVNYDEATRAAADRGHFADGGGIDPQAMAFAQRMNQKAAGKGGTPGAAPAGGAGKGGSPGTQVAPAGLQMGGHGVALPPDFGGTSGQNAGGAGKGGVPASATGRASNPFGAAMAGLSQHNALPTQLSGLRSSLPSFSGGTLSQSQINDLIAGGNKDTKPPVPVPPAPAPAAPAPEAPAPVASAAPSDPSMDAWRASQTNMMFVPLSGAARGGAIDPSMAGAGFADGGAMGDDYIRQLLTQLLSKSNSPQFGGAGIYGKPIAGTGPYGTPSSSGAGQHSLTPARLPEIPRQGPSALESGMSTINQAVNAGQALKTLGGWGKEGLVGAPGKVDPKTGQTTGDTSGLFGKGGKFDGIGGAGKGGTPGSTTPGPAPSVPSDIPSLDDLLNGSAGTYFRGGRIGYAHGGLPYSQIDDEYIPEDLTKDPDIADLVKEQKSMEAPLPAIQKGSSGGSGKSGSGAGRSVGSALGAVGGSFLPIPGGTAVGSALGGLFGGLFKDGGRVGYDDGGVIGEGPVVEDDPVARLLEQLRQSRPDVPNLPPGPKDVPLEIARDRLPGMERYERQQEPKGGAAPPTEPVGMPPVYPHVPMPESGTAGPKEGPLPPPQSVTVPAMPPLESKTVKSAPDFAPAATPASGDRADILKRARNAIGHIESTDRYNIVGPETTYQNGTKDRPYGRYGVMGNNIPQWTREALGREMTPDDFLKDAEAQDKVFDHRFGTYLDKHGNPQDAASVWFSGRPQSQAGNAKDVLGTSVPGYIAKFNKGFDGQGQGQQQALNQPPISPGMPPSQPAPVVPTSPSAPAAGGAATPPADQPNWFDRNERLITSILTGLGGAAAMGMNPRANLAGVALAGLGAGAGAYAQQGLKERELGLSEKAKELETAKYLTDNIVKSVDPRTGQTTYFNKLSGTYMNESQYQAYMAKALGKMAPANAPGAPTAAGAPATSAAAGTEPTKPAASVTAEEENPEFLNGRARQSMALAQKARAEGNTAQADALEKQAKEDRDRAISLTGAVKKAELPVEIEKKGAESNIGVQQKALTDAQERARTALASIQQARLQLGLMFDEKGNQLLNGGPMGDWMAKSAAYLKQMGFADKAIDYMLHTNPENAQELQKMATIVGTELTRSEIGSGSRMLATEFNQFVNNATPNINMLPQAFKWIIERTVIPKAEQQMKVYEGIAGLDPTKDNIAKHIYEAEKANPWAPLKAPERSERKEDAPQQITKPRSYTPEEIQAARDELERRRKAGRP